METKIADNYIFDSVLDKSVGDSDKTPFVRKNLNYIVDQQAGNSSYTSGQIIIDSTSLASSGNTFQDWSNAYVVLPYNVNVEATAVIATTSAGPTNAGLLNYLSSLKNNALIDSITVEQGGKTIINQDGVFEDDYGYNEGHYHFDNEYFWEGLIEGIIDDSIGLEVEVGEFLNEFHYLTTDDREELRKLYLESLKKQTETNE
jgi:hypothetical protein